ncbi:MAG TPA: septum formation initiator family protein [Polyangiaceae bacterium]|nr:septum formation initiator family protein [Polyangiaceae bacterium]
MVLVAWPTPRGTARIPAEPYRYLERESRAERPSEQALRTGPVPDFWTIPRGLGILGAAMRSGLSFAQRLLPISVLLVAVSSVPIMIFSPDGLARLERLEQEKVRVDEEISRASAEIRALRAQIDRMRSDPATIEEVARDELGLVRQTEVVFQFSRR